MSDTSPTEQKTTPQRLDLEIRAIELAAHSSGEPAQLAEGLNKLFSLLGKLVGRDLNVEKEYVTFVSAQPHLTHLFATRISAAACSLLLNPALKLDSDVLHLLMTYRAELNDLFRVSAYGGTVHARNILIDRGQKDSPDGATNLTGIDNIYRSILLATLDDIYPEQLKYLISVAGADEAVMILSLLDERAVFSVRGDEYRNVLLQERRAFASLPLSVPLALLASHAWMNCSYATSPYKHDIKIPLNQWFKRLLDKHRVRFSKFHAKKANTRKKTMVVAAESFGSNHAMYRWYAPIMRALKQHYYLIVAARKNDIDETAIKLFDQYVEVKDEIVGLQDVLNTCRPDVVFYPSLGMRVWSIALANIRWAPLQVMMLGHPATSYVETIDAAMMGRKMVNASCFAENVLALEADAGAIIDSIVKQMPVRTTPKTPSSISIAIPCVSMKINPVFMTMLQEIQKGCNKRIHYSFFPNAVGIPLGAIASRIRDWIPTARVEHRMGYDAYLARLVEHDIALSSFPFGNASSLIDCLLVGLPTVTWKGAEPHSLTDFAVIDACGLTEECGTNSMEEYLERVIKLVNDDAYRESVREKILDGRIDKIHHAEERPFVDECVEAIMWAEKNSEILRNSRGNVYYKDGNW